MAKKRITAKQKAARVKNIAIARKYRKRGTGRSKNKKPTAAQIKANLKAGRSGSRKKKITQMRANIKARKSPERKKAQRLATSKGQAGQAFKRAYKQVQASTGGRTRKDYARRVGHTAAIKADMISGKAMARKYARGVARKKYKMDAKGAKQFSRGYINSIMNDLNRGA